MVQFGYIKANKLSNEYILRQDNEPRIEAKKISIDDIGEWTNISNKVLGSTTNTILADVQTRANFINTIVDQVIKGNTNGVNINFTGIDNIENFERFLIELAPRLREIGATTCVKINNEINENDIKNVVDYIVENE